MHARVVARRGTRALPGSRAAQPHPRRNSGSVRSIGPGRADHNDCVSDPQDQVAVLQAQLRQAQLHTEQSKVDAGGRVRQAEADLAGAEAQLAQQRASYQLALFDKALVMFELRFSVL